MVGCRQVCGPLPTAPPDSESSGGLDRQKITDNGQPKGWAEAIPEIGQSAGNQSQGLGRINFKDWRWPRAHFINHNKDGCCFSTETKFHANLFEAFKITFDTTSKITKDKERHYQFGVSSKKMYKQLLIY